MPNIVTSALVAASSFALVVASAPTPAAAQAAGARTVKAVCCKCLDGKKPTASISTGTAPWRASTAAGGTALSPVTGASNPAWTALAGSSWVGPANAPKGAGNYTYELVIQVPRCVIGARMSIEGRFAADNKATLYFNNNQIAVSQGAANLGFQAAAVTPFTITGLTAGSHVLKVVVYNMNNVTGLNLSGQVTTGCPASTELGALSAGKDRLAGLGAGTGAGLGLGAGAGRAETACGCASTQV